MREIKFRAWDKKYREMIYCLNHFLYFEGIIRAIGDKDWSAPRENYELMQYTGLKDRNGKEIYEGDIVKNNWNGVFQAIEDIRSVNWLFSDGFLAGQESGDKLLNAEVIGNVYENPELLKEEK